MQKNPKKQQQTKKLHKTNQTNCKSRKAVEESLKSILLAKSTD